MILHLTDRTHTTREGRQHRYRDNFMRSTVSTLRSAVMRRVVARGQLECVCPWRLAPSEPRPRREHRSPPAVREAWLHHRRFVLTHLSPSVVLELDPAGSFKPLARERNCELDELADFRQPRPIAISAVHGNPRRAFDTAPFQRVREPGTDYGGPSTFPVRRGTGASFERPTDRSNI